MEKQPSATRTAAADKAARFGRRLWSRAALRKLAMAIVTVFLFFGFLEAGTRLLWRQDSGARHVGIVLEGAGRQVSQGGVVYRTNSLGIRGREPWEVEDSRPRVLAVGDSFLWGDGLSEEALVTAKLESLLRESYPHAIVVNAGISAHNTGDEHSQLVRLVPVYRPDHVLVFFFTNDVLAREGTDGGRNATYGSWRQNLKEFLRSRSKFCALIYYQYKTKYAAKYGVPQGLLPRDYFGLNDTKPGWVAFKKAALEIRDYCADNGLTLQFVIIPTLTSLNEHYPYAELRQKVRAFLQRSSIEFVDLFPVLAEYDPAELWVSRDNSHWNEKGTSAAARAIAERLLEAATLHTVEQKDPS